MVKRSRFLFLQQKHAFFQVVSTLETANGTISPDDAVARDEDGETILGKGGSYKTGGSRVSDLGSNLAIRSDLSVGDACNSIQYRALQGVQPA